MRFSSLLSIALLASGPTLAETATAAESAAQSHACADIAQPAERLACYDAMFPPVAAASDRDQALSEFGLNSNQVRQRTPEHLRDEAPERIEAAVAAVTDRANGGRVITLDNGQVWVLTEATSKGPLKAGDRIAIRTAALGTFMLVTPSRVALRARRID